MRQLIEKLKRGQSSSEIPSPNATLQLDISQFSVNNAAIILEYEGQFIGHVINKEDMIVLQLNESAPQVSIIGLPAQQKFFVEAANDIELNLVGASLSVLIVKANNMGVSSTIRVKEVSIHCKVLQVNEQGGLLFTLPENPPALYKREIRADQFILLPGAQCQFNHALIQSKEVVSEGKLWIDQCIFKFDSVDLAGFYSIQNSRGETSQQVRLEGDASSIIRNVKFEAEGVSFLGQIQCHNVDFVTDTFEIVTDQVSHFEECDFQVSKSLTISETAQASLKNTVINTSTLHLLGHALVENCELEADHCVTSDYITLKSSSILATLSWQDEGATIESCDVQVETATLKKKTAIKSTTIKTNVLTNESTGSIEESRVTVHQYLYSMSGNLQFKHSYLQTNQHYSQGHIQFIDGSYHQTNYLQQTSGVLTVNGSVIHDKGLLFTMQNATLAADAHSVIKIKSGLFEGESRWQESQLAAMGPVTFCGRTTSEKAAISSLDAIYVVRSAHEFNASLIQTEKGVIAEGVTLQDESEINCEDLSILGQTIIDGKSMVTADDLQVFKQLFIKKSAIYLQRALITFYGSSFTAEEGVVQAENMTFSGKIDANDALFRADSTLLLANFSDAHVQVVTLTAGKHITHARYSKVHGDRVNEKAELISNEGSIAVDKLKMSASQGVMNFGTIHAQQLDMTTPYVFNILGTIRATDSANVQTALLMNYSGCLTARSRLSVDSLVHVNMLGLESSYDLNIRSVYAFHEGHLLLPSLPNTWKDAFTKPRLLSYFQLGLAQALPNYRNLISFGFILAPHAKSAGQFLVDYARSGERLADLPVKIYTLTQSAVSEYRKQFYQDDNSEMLAFLSEQVRTLLTLAQCAKSAKGAYGEMFNRQPAGTTPAPAANQPSLAKSPVRKWVKSVGRALLPSMNSQCVLNHTAGATLGVKAVDSSWYMFNDGIIYAYDYSGSHKRGINRGVLVGGELSLSAQIYENYGRFRGVLSADIQLEDYFFNHDGGECDLFDFSMRANSLQNAGHLSFSTGQVNLNKLVNTASGQLHLTSVGGAVKETLGLNGQYTLTKTSFRAGNLSLRDKGSIQQSNIQTKGRLTQKGSLSIGNTSFTGEDVDLDGLSGTDGTVTAVNRLTIKNTHTVGVGLKAKNANLSDSTFKDESLVQGEGTQIQIKNHLQTERIVVNNMDVDSKSHMDKASTYEKSRIITGETFEGIDSTLEQNSSLAAQVVELKGNTSVDSAAIKAEQRLKQEGHLRGAKAEFLGQEIDLTDVLLTDSHVHAKDKLKVKNADTVDSEFSGKHLDIQDSRIKSSKAKSSSILLSDLSEGENHQIQATDSLHMQGVILGSQSIQARTMEVEQTRMEHSVLAISNHFSAKDVCATDAIIEAGDASFDAEITLSDALITAKDDVVFEEGAEVTTHDAAFKAGQQIVHRAQHEQTGTLSLEANDVQFTDSSSIQSAEDGVDNAFVVKAKHGDLQGWMYLHNGHVDIEHLSQANDLIGQRGVSAKQTFTQSLTVKTAEPITLTHPRQCALEVIAPSIILSSPYQSRDDVALTATNASLTINMPIGGKKVALQSEHHNVEVLGVTVKGEEYVFIQAGYDVKLAPIECSYKGPIGDQKKYAVATIIGGKGHDDTNGAGVDIHANHKVIIDAPQISAEGGVVISGKQGVTAQARSLSYSNKAKINRVKFKESVSKSYQTKITSSNSRINVHSQEGDVVGVGGCFVAAQGTDISAKKGISFKGITSEITDKDKQSSCFGLRSSKRTEKHQDVVPVEFISGGGQTRLHAEEGDIIALNVRFRGHGDVAFEATHGTITLETSKLNHSIKQKSRQLSVSVPLVDTAALLFTGNVKKLLHRAEPVLHHFDALLAANDPLEALTSVCNMGVHGYNSANALAEGNYGTSLMQNAGFIPKINFTLTSVKSSMTYQTVAPGGIAIVGKVSFQAQGMINLVGVPISANQLELKAQKIVIAGHQLKTTQKTKTSSVSVGMSFTGAITDASVAHSSQEVSRKQHWQPPIEIKQDVSIDAEEMNLEATINCDSISGQVDELTVRSTPDEFKLKNKAASASTTGSLSVHESQASERIVSQTARIHTRSAIKKGDFNVKQAHLIAAAITSEGHNGFEPEALAETKLHDHSRQRGLGFSGNPLLIANAKDSAPSKSISRLRTVSIFRQRADRVVEHRNTIYGRDGVSDRLQSEESLNTGSPQSAKKVLKDSKQRLALDIPLGIANLFTNSDSQDAKRLEPPIVPISNPTDDVLLPNSEPTEAPINIDDDLHEAPPENDVIPGDTEKKKTSPPAAFSPKPKPQVVGIKKGSGDQSRLFKKQGGHYTTLQKELAASAKKSQYSSKVDIPLFKYGEKDSCLSYQGRIDPVRRLLMVEGELGKKYCFHLVDDGFDLGTLGSFAFSVDLASFEATLKGQIEAGPISISASLQADLGVMGPSLSASGATPTLNLFGFTLKIKADKAVGLGYKVMVAAGAGVDAAHLKGHLFYKLGLFAGVGASHSMKIELSADEQFADFMQRAYENILETDPVGSNIIEKLKSGQALKSWEREYLDDATEQVYARAQVERWLGGP